MSCGKVDDTKDKKLGKKALQSLENPDDLKLDFQISDFNIKYDHKKGFHCKYHFYYCFLISYI